jgi:hypothetical protein
MSAQLALELIDRICFLLLERIPFVDRDNNGAARVDGIATDVRVEMSNPSTASMISIATSARSNAFLAMMTDIFSAISLVFPFLRIPAVSMSRNF